MSSAEPSSLLRAGLLDGVAIVLARPVGVGAGAGAGHGAPAETIAQGCQRLGARLAHCELPEEGGWETDDAAAREAAVEVSVQAALEELGGAAALLVVDARGWFARDSGRGPLVECLQASWDVTRAVVNLAFLPAHGGRIVLLAPAAGAEHAAAAAAGLENLARTLSIEWARFGITTVALAPGAGTAESELASVVAYLASPAGAYFSGCLLDLRGPLAPPAG